jgi:NADP-dependent 3-hydroxy acid dehydrogenase YdfG
VYLTGRRQNDLDMAAALIGDGVTPVRGDVQERGDLDQLYEKIKEEKGKIDILAANAGFIDPQPLVDATEENFGKTFGTNERGLLFTVHKALPLFREAAPSS